MSQQHQAAPQNFDFSRPQPPIPQQQPQEMSGHQQNSRLLQQTNFDAYHQQHLQQQLQNQQLQNHNQQQQLRQGPQYVPRLQQQPRPYLPTIHNRSPLMVPPPNYNSYHQQAQQQQQQTQHQHFANLGSR